MSGLEMMEPLGHDLDLDNPDDVDWLVKWGHEAVKVIKNLEAELAEYRGLIDGDVDVAWRELIAERDALKKWKALAVHYETGHAADQLGCDEECRGFPHPEIEEEER